MLHLIHLIHLHDEAADGRAIGGDDGDGGAAPPRCAVRRGRRRDG